MMDTPSIVSYQGKAMSFPVGTSLHLIRSAFHFSGGFLRCTSDGRGDMIVLPDQPILPGKYELIIIGPGFLSQAKDERTQIPPELPSIPGSLITNLTSDPRKRGLVKTHTVSADPASKHEEDKEPQKRSRRMTEVQSFAEYEQEIFENDIQCSSGEISLSNAIRSLVSKKKKRFVNHKFNLDLAYITDRIIAMGFPAIHVESHYRNSRRDVVKFLETTHGDKYKVWNLCKEPAYQYESTVFNGRVSCLPFYDHNAPSLQQLLAFCQQATEWLDKDEENVIVVHCKAGKGRTGLMICSLLCYRYQEKGFDVKLALDFYSIRRTENGKGVTIPSQKRFVGYLDRIVKMKDPGSFILQLPTASVIISQITINSTPKWGPDVCFRISYGEGGEEFCYESPHTHQQAAKGGLIDIKLNLALIGEVKIEFFASKEIGKEQYFYLWFHCAFVSQSLNYRLEFPLSELDGKAKSNKHQSLFGQDFKCVLGFHYRSS